MKKKVTLFAAIILLLQSMSIITSWGVQTPSITTQPASSNPALGGSLNLSVQASVSDGGTVSYQWKYRATTSDTATNLSDTGTATNRISGSQLSTLTIDTITAANSGIYSVVVTNTLAGVSTSVTSSEAVVYVLLASEDFQGSSLTNPSDWIMTYKSGTSAFPECLTAGTGTLVPAAGDGTSRSVTTSSMTGCTYASGTGSGHASIASVDSNTAGQGALRLTSSVNDQATFVLYNKSLSTQNGLDISFNAAMWGATVLSSETVNSRSYKFAADGFTFFLKDGTNTDTSAGAAGGSLGYGSQSGSASGIDSALFGLGIDGYGNFSGRSFGGTDCYGSSNITAGTYASTISRNGVSRTTNETYVSNWYSGASNNTGNHNSQYKDSTWNIGNQVVFRGPSGSSGTSPNQVPSKLNGYCPISTNLPPKLVLSETSSATTVADGIWTTRNSANTRLYRILIDGKSVTTPKIYLYVDGSLVLTVNAPEQYKISDTFKFGFTGSTGGANQKIDIWSTRVNTYTGITAPDAPTNVTATQGSTAGSFNISWSHTGQWGIGEAASDGVLTRKFVATVYDSTGTTATNFSCSTSVTSGTPANSCTITDIPSGTYTIKVVAINFSSLSSANSTVSSSITSNGDVVISDCSGAGAIQNGSFENTSIRSYLDGSSPTGWFTTALATRNGNTQATIELAGINSGAAAGISTFPDGNLAAEIAADNGGDADSAGGVRQGLYQDVSTLVGARVFWSYWHHFRSGLGTADQIARFRAAPTPSGTPAGNIWTSTEQGAPFGSGVTPTTNVTHTVRSTDGWLQSTGTFLPTTSRTRFLFSNDTSPAAGYGNLVDDIRFTTYAACPITVNIIAGRSSDFVVKSNEQDTNNFKFYGPQGAVISALSGVPAAVTASVSSIANTSSTISLSASTLGTYVGNYRVSYTYSGTTYTTSSTLTVRVLPEVTAIYPASVPFDPTLKTVSLPGIRLQRATNAYICFDQVLNSSGASIGTPSLTVSQSSLTSGVALVSSGVPFIDSGTVSSLTRQASLIKITSTSGVLGKGGSKYLRVRVSSIDNTDGVSPSCANGISFIIQFRTIKITQTRRFVAIPKNGRQNN